MDASRVFRFYLLYVAYHLLKVIQGTRTAPQAGATILPVFSVLSQRASAPVSSLM
jgi:hypothetical protein